MTHQTHRQTHTKALIFAFITLLVVSIGCKKENKVIPPPETANELIGTNWIEDVPEYIPTENARIFTFYQNNGKDSIRVTKNGLPFDNFWNGNKINTNMFEYTNGKGKVFSKTFDIPFYCSFTINDNVLELQGFGFNGGYSFEGTNEEKEIGIQKVKDALNRYPNILIFQNGEILTNFNNFDPTKYAMITTDIRSIKFKKQQ